jgi:hypothetical protein
MEKGTNGEKKEEYDAELEFASYEYVNASYYIIWGWIWADKKKRFHEGQFVHTSAIDHRVVPPKSLKKGMIVQTENHRYLLI